MKEYTILGIISVISVIFLDNISGVKILRKVEFYILLFFMFLFKLLVNGYLTGQYIVIYNPRFFLNIRLGTIPIEDFLFGFSMIAMTIILWEYFKGKEKKGGS